MSKKDRIAIVLSILYLFLPISAFFDRDEGAGVFLLVLFVAYWGYRFIKNDISFLKIKDK